MQHMSKPADIGHPFQGHCVELPSDKAAGSVQPGSAGANSSPDTAFLGSFDRAADMSPDAHISVERMLRRVQAAEPTAAMSDGLQSTEELSHLLQGTACLVWLPDGQLSGEPLRPDLACLNTPPRTVAHTAPSF